MIIDLRKFVEARESDWKALEELTENYSQNGGKDWSIERIEKFNSLYKDACSDLAEAQTFSNDQELIRYLETVVARAYAQIYGRRRRLTFSRLFYWAHSGFPAAFRRNFRYFLASMAITLAGGMLGGFLVVNDPHAKSTLFQGFGHLMGDPSERVASEESGDHKEAASFKAQFSGFLMTHNIRVSLFALSLGLLWGVGTLALLFYNGAILGAVCVDYVLAGEGVFLTAWLLPHGVVEIPAILIAGQGGFVLANALIGWKSSDTMGKRFAQVRGDVAYLIGGIALLLVWAGIVESYLSQTHEPEIQYSTKIAVGVIELGLLVAYLSYGDRLGRWVSRLRQNAKA